MSWKPTGKEFVPESRGITENDFQKMAFSSQSTNAAFTLHKSEAQAPFQFNDVNAGFTEA